MVKSVSTLFGIGLLILTIAGWVTTGAALWLAWLDLVGTLCAFWVASGPDSRSARIGSPIALGIGLFVLWIIALAVITVPGWQVWWNFGFACAFVALGLADYFSERSAIPHSPRP